MKHLILLLGFVFGFEAHSQNKNKQKLISCAGLESIQLNAFVVLKESKPKEFIRKKDLVNYELQLHVSDSSYKIIGFLALYDCHSGSLVDINEKVYLGNRIKSGDPFIRNIWVGDFLRFDCINVEKNGKRYLANGVSFQIN